MSYHMTIARIYVKNGLSVPLAVSFPNQVFVFCFPADLFGFYSGTFDLVGGFNFLKVSLRKLGKRNSC